MRRFILTICLLLTLLTCAQPTYAEWRYANHYNGISVYWQTDTISTSDGYIYFEVKWVNDTASDLKVKSSVLNTLMPRSGELVKVTYIKQYDEDGTLLHEGPWLYLIPASGTGMEPACRQVVAFVQQNNYPW